MKLKRKVTKTLLSVAILIGVLLVGQAIVWQYFLQKPLKLPAEGLMYTFESGETVHSLANDLQAEGVLNRPRLLRVLARLRGFDRALQAGEYHFVPGVRPGQMLQQMAEGKVIQYPFTIVEGWTFAQLLEALGQDNVLLQTVEGLSSAEVMTILEQANQHPEGRFLPNTYFFARGDSDVEILQRSYQAMEDYLAARWPHRAPELPYNSPYEAVIMASIVEREAKLPAERAKIAGVLVKRLKINMGLQADATVIYGLGEQYGDVLTRTDLQHRSPYNTYQHAGLPPTPIAMPGIAAIEAALLPEITDALYYVVDDEALGSHVFSATLEEHNRAAARYRAR